MHLIGASVSEPTLLTANGCAVPVIRCQLALHHAARAFEEANVPSTIDSNIYASTGKYTTVTCTTWTLRTCCIYVKARFVWTYNIILQSLQLIRILRSLLRIKAEKYRRLTRGVRENLINIKQRGRGPIFLRKYMRKYGRIGASYTDDIGRGSVITFESTVHIVLCCTSECSY